MFWHSRTSNNATAEAADDLVSARRRMIGEQLQARGIISPRVLAAMNDTPRERFMAQGLGADAYADRAAPIDCGQTISQPYMVGLMTQALELSGDEHVLEIGTGSGYQVAVLARLAASVVSIERHEQLSQHAATVLLELGCRNATLIVGDGAAGWPERAPYDRVIVTAAASQIPPALLEQLAEGGILVIPIGDTGTQVLQAVRKIDGRPHATPLSNCRFVPFVGAQSETE